MAKILVVDDDAAQRARLKHLLETAGYTVATAPDAIQGLVSVTRDPPDLILSDILMPRMDGFTFIREVKSRPDLRAIPFLFVTSTLVSEDDRQFAQMLGAEAILARTDDASAALGIVESCLKRRSRAPSRPQDESGEWQSPAASAYGGPDLKVSQPSADEQVTHPSTGEPDVVIDERPAPSPDPAQFLQVYSQQKTVQLEEKIAQLEQANLELEQRARELAAISSERDRLLETVQAHALELETRVEERAEYLENLGEISRMINAALSPEPLLDEIVQRGVSLLRVDECSLFLYNPDTETFHGAASSAVNRDAIRRLYFSAQEAPAVRSLVAQRSAAAFCNIDPHDQGAWSLLPRKVLPAGVRADTVLAVPLAVREQVHGLLVCAENATERVFSHDELQVITQLADQAALALENARLLYESSRRLEELRLAEELRVANLAQAAAERERLVRRASEHSRELELQVQEKRRHLNALATISKSINGTLNPEAVLDQIVRSACSLVHVDKCNLFLFNPDTNTFHGAASSTLPRETIQKLYFPATNNAPILHIVQRRTPITLNDTDRDPGFPLLDEQFHAKAALIQPIVARGQVLGVILAIDSNVHRAFKPEETELLTVFADQAASTLENARLFYEATRALDELSAAHQQLDQTAKLAAAVEMAGAAAHQLGQPMVAILEQTRRARQQAASPEVKQVLQTIEEHVQQMAQIVNQMRRITRYEDKSYAGSSKLLNRTRAASSS